MDRGEFQQDSVLKQLEVLKEEEKEFQNLKVSPATQPLPTSTPGCLPWCCLPCHPVPALGGMLGCHQHCLWGTHGAGERVG